MKNKKLNVVLAILSLPVTLYAATVFAERDVNTVTRITNSIFESSKIATNLKHNEFVESTKDNLNNNFMTLKLANDSVNAELMKQTKLNKENTDSENINFENFENEYIYKNVYLLPISLKSDRDSIINSSGENKGVKYNTMKIVERYDLTKDSLLLLKFKSENNQDMFALILIKRTYGDQRNAMVREGLLNLSVDGMQSIRYVDSKFVDKLKDIKQFDLDEYGWRNFLNFIPSLKVISSDKNIDTGYSDKNIMYVDKKFITDKEIARQNRLKEDKLQGFITNNIFEKENLIINVYEKNIGMLTSLSLPVGNYNELVRRNIFWGDYIEFTASNNEKIAVLLREKDQGSLKKGSIYKVIPMALFDAQTKFVYELGVNIEIGSKDNKTNVTLNDGNSLVEIYSGINSSWQDIISKGLDFKKIEQIRESSRFLATNFYLNKHKQIKEKIFTVISFSLNAEKNYLIQKVSDYEFSGDSKDSYLILEVNTNEKNEVLSAEKPLNLLAFNNKPRVISKEVFKEIISKKELKYVSVVYEVSQETSYMQNNLIKSKENNKNWIPDIPFDGQRIKITQLSDVVIKNRLNENTHIIVYKLNFENNVGDYYYELMKKDDLLKKDNIKETISVEDFFNSKIIKAEDFKKNIF